jgi:hypothetical protein
MLNAEFVLGTVLLPAVIAGLVLALGWKLWRRDDKPQPYWTGAVAIAGGFLAAFIVIDGVGAVPSEERTLSGLDWTFWGTGVVLLLGSLEGKWTAHESVAGSWLRSAAHITLRGLASLLLWRVLSNSSEAGIMVVAASLVGFLLLAASANSLASQRCGAAAPLTLWTSATGLAVVAGLSGSAKLGQLGGALAATLGAAVVLAWWRPRLSLAHGGATAAVFVLAALGLNAHFYSYMTGTDGLLLAASVLTPLALRIPAFGRVEGARRAGLAFALALIPVAIAVARAALAFEPDPYAGY